MGDFALVLAPRGARVHGSRLRPPPAHDKASAGGLSRRAPFAVDAAGEPERIVDEVAAAGFEIVHGAVNPATAADGEGDLIALARKR